MQFKYRYKTKWINEVHKEICEALQIDTCQLNKSSQHWEIKTITKEFQRQNKSVSEKINIRPIQEERFENFVKKKKTQKEPSSICVSSENDTEKVTTTTQQEIVISQLKNKNITLKKNSKPLN